MTTTFQPEHERTFIERFAATVPSPAMTRYRLNTLCESFRFLLSGQTPLNYTDRTDWVVPWRDSAAKRYSKKTLYTRLLDFARMTRWLFKEGLVEHDAFAHVRVWYAYQGVEAPLWLRYDLHRVIERYVPGACGAFSSERRAKVRLKLLDFNAFLNRSLKPPIPGPGDLFVDTHLITAWLRHRRTCVQARVVVEEGAELHRFMEFTRQEGAITGHALAELVHDYGRKGYQGVIEALLSPDPRGALSPLRTEPRFASNLAKPLQEFTAYKRSLGQDFRVQETILAHLDRFLRQFPDEERLSAPLIKRWIATTPNIGVNARRRRWLWVRQFCRWMAFKDPSFFVPEPLDIPYQRTPSRRPFIYTVGHIWMLLEAASKLGPAGSLRACTFRCIIGLLYGAALRISEALALNVGDFDVGQKVLLISETKFHKSRYVPLAPSVSASIVAYLHIRSKAGHTLLPEVPFFANRYGRRYSYQAVASTFHALLRQCGLRGPRGQPGPRLHDLRHTAATYRLTRWYEEGVDINAKLPLLSTYMGHGSVAATQIYLSITAELLHHGAARLHRARRLHPAFSEVSHEL